VTAQPNAHATAPLRMAEARGLPYLTSPALDSTKPRPTHSRH
jgi:hypothetical protein